MFVLIRITAREEVVTIRVKGAVTPVAAVVMAVVALVGGQAPGAVTRVVAGEINSNKVAGETREDGTIQIRDGAIRTTTVAGATNRLLDLFY